ncbi:MAG: VOC family protein [Eubacteriaceae bacterium]|nr:VOC family protein [Eubacteriaceae bacterium]
MIAHVTIHTSKLNETFEFYNWLLGLTVSRKIERPNGDILFLGEDETKFELIQDDNALPINSKGVTIGFAVDNLDEKLAMLEERGIAHSDITGSRFAFFTDLNGLEIQLYEGH